MFTRFADLIAIEISNDRASHAQLGALIGECSTALPREQFIAILGHDLRGPLASIGIGAEYLVAPGVPLTPDARRVALRIGDSARRMGRLINDVLDFVRGRLGGGFSVVLKEVHDIGAALRQVVAEFEQAHPDRRFVVDIEAPSAVLCDRDRLQQLCSGGIGSPSLLTVSTLPVIFQPFWRRNAASGREHDGLGFGLFICAEIVRAHGGQIEVVSSRETGTTFAARLPIQQVA